MSERATALRSALTERVVIADGAMGTMLQASDATPDDFQDHEGCDEILNVTRPDIVKGVHSAYLPVDRGADQREDIIVECLSFPIATGQEETRRDAIETINAIAELKRRYPEVQTTLGLSNVSFGLKPAARAVSSGASSTASGATWKPTSTRPSPSGRPWRSSTTCSWTA